MVPLQCAYHRFTRAYADPHCAIDIKAWRSHVGLGEEGLGAGEITVLLEYRGTSALCLYHI